MITRYKTVRDRDQSCDISITVSTDLSEICWPIIMNQCQLKMNAKTMTNNVSYILRGIPKDQCWLESLTMDFIDMLGNQRYSERKQSELKNAFIQDIF